MSIFDLLGGGSGLDAATLRRSKEWTQLRKLHAQKYRIEREREEAAFEKGSEEVERLRREIRELGEEPCA